MKPMIIIGFVIGRFGGVGGTLMILNVSFANRRAFVIRNVSRISRGSGISGALLCFSGQVFLENHSLRVRRFQFFSSQFRVALPRRRITALPDHPVRERPTAFNESKRNRFS
jgi:hypothetical protein